ncbi:hypothetical protein [Nocardiopsis prasina]|uniref:hypothetical protein n=1 Tax=Nocardiopsis prasina TaxID=2015 RepID=UPI000594195D|nr:hypothetical protein [Nocardiopsis prasina]
MSSHHPEAPSHRRFAARPVSLLPTEALARRALSSRLLRAAVDLARWCGPVTPVDVDGMPDPHDVRAAIERFGLWPSGLGRDRERREAWAEGITCVSQAEEFTVAWRTAQHLGMIECETGQARPAPELERWLGSPGRVLRWWTLAFHSCVEQSLRGIAKLEPHTTLARLYESPNGAHVPLRLVTQEILPAREAHYLPARCPAWNTVLLTQALWQLSDTGAISLGWHGPHPEDAHTPRAAPTWVELTDLGRFGIRQIILAEERPAPLTEEFIRLDADEFLDALADFSFDGQLVALTAWLDARTPEQALREIVTVSSGPGLALRRWNATMALGTISSRVEPQLYALLRSGDPTLASLASVVLLASRMLSEHERARLTAEFGHWTAIDMFAAATCLGETGLKSFLVSEAAEGIDRVLLDDVARLWRLEHPDTRSVLRMLGQHHPDPSIAARARAASAHAPARVEGS